MAGSPHLGQRVLLHIPPSYGRAEPLLRPRPSCDPEGQPMLLSKSTNKFTRRTNKSKTTRTICTMALATSPRTPTRASTTPGSTSAAMTHGSLLTSAHLLPPILEHWNVYRVTYPRGKGWFFGEAQKGSEPRRTPVKRAPLSQPQYQQDQKDYDQDGYHRVQHSSTHRTLNSFPRASPEREVAEGPEPLERVI